MNVFWVSRKGYKRLADRVAELEKKLNDTKREMATSFATDNDIRENPEYMDLRNKVQYVLPKQLAEARSNLAQCAIFEDSRDFTDLSNGRVTLGSLVEIANASGDRSTYLLLGFEEGGSAPNAVSYLSPIGRALMGASVGDTVAFSIAGRRTELTILAIARGV